MNRSGFRRAHGSVANQAFQQAVVDPALAAIHAVSRVTVAGIQYGLTNATSIPSRDSRSIDNPPSDVSVSEGGFCHNEPMPTPVGSSENHLSLEENLPSAPTLTINPRYIAAIPGEPLLEKLEDEDLQNAVVHQNSKLFKNTKGQYVLALLSERTK